MMGIFFCFFQNNFLVTIQFIFIEKTIIISINYMLHTHLFCDVKWALSLFNIIQSHYLNYLSLRALHKQTAISTPLNLLWLKVMKQQKINPVVFSLYFGPGHRDQNQKFF